MDFKKKQKSDLSLHNFWIRSVAIFIIIVMIVLIVADIKIYLKRRQFQVEVSKYENQIKQLKDRNKKLEDEIANSDNIDYIEKVAREEQNMQRPGEKVVSFIMPEKTEDESDDQNFWDSKNWFGWLSKFFAGMVQW
jgi:cell division protein FtsL